MGVGRALFCAFFGIFFEGGSFVFVFVFCYSVCLVLYFIVWSKGEGKGETSRGC